MRTHGQDPSAGADLQPPHSREDALAPGDRDSCKPTQHLRQNTVSPSSFQT